MKRPLAALVAVLVALTVMAPGPPDRAEQLKVDNGTWEIEPFFDNSTGGSIYGVTLAGLECKYGLATAGEHADFQIGVTLSGVAYDNNEWDYGWSQDVTVAFHKDPTATKDSDGYIGILADPVSWNGDDDGSQFVVDEIALSLVGPSGQTVGQATTVDGGGTMITGPTFGTPVKMDQNGWDYSPELGAIVVPLLAAADQVDDLASQGYQVSVDFSVIFPHPGGVDGTASGSGSTPILMTIEPSPDLEYVQIEPLTTSTVEWNGDDDGSGIVNGTLTLYDMYGNEKGAWQYEEFPVTFGSASGDVAP
jgi:hypothetical protein